jgi:hypothetical protein
LADQERHVSTDEARAASTPHVVRYVLAVSLILVVIGFALVILI